MKPKRPRLNPLLLLALLLTAVAVIFAPDDSQEPDTVVPANRSSRNRAPVRPEPPAVQDTPGQQAAYGQQAASGRPERSGREGPIIDIFAVPRPPAARQAVPVAPPVPAMPPFDYQYMGRVVDQGEQSLFFTRGGRPYVVKPGDTLDGNFLFESVSGNAAVFVYVPLSMKTTVVLGEGK